MKKVLYLGGFFQAEFSLQESFLDNGVDIQFLIDDNDYAKENYWTNPYYHNFRIKDSIKIVSSFMLEDFIDGYKPDVIIHRHYMYKPLMHLNSISIARRLKIPFVHLEMELSPNLEDYGDLQNVFTDCDIFLYAHNYETPTLKYMLENKKSCYFYPYGVSSFERSLPNVIKDRGIGAFGYPRIEERERCSNLNMFLEGIKKLGEKLHVYGNWKYSPWIDFSSLIVHLEYKWEEATEVMNRHRIAINFETLPNGEGAYSHKMFQTIGCGLPTLTFYKKSINELFLWMQNPIFVENSEDIFKWVKHLLNNKEDWNNVSLGGERFIHEKFDWFQRFWIIAKKEGIW